MLMFLVTILILSPVPVSAQSLELFATSGLVQFWNDESNLGLGVSVGGGVGFKSPHGWGIEVIAETQRANRNFDSGVRFDSTVAGARGRIIKYFDEGRTQPYAGGSVGVTRIKSTRTEPFGGAAFPNTATSGTVSGFAGLRLAAGNRLFVRPEFEISKGSEHLGIGGMVAIGASW